MSVRNLVLLVIVLSLSMFVIPGASAHGRTPRLEISAERLNPGGVLDIRGVEFDYEEAVTLYLERQGLVIELGQIIADLDGIFIHTIVLPPDLPGGEYTLRGVTEHHDVLGPTLTVQGPAVPAEGGGQGERDEDDGLLAPMPTYAPGVVPGGVSQPEAQPAAPETPVSSHNTLPLVLAGSVVVGILIAFRLRSGTKR